MKHLLLILAICTMASSAHAQTDELAVYRQMFKTADSLKAIGQSSAIDTAEAYRLTKQLDQKHPTEYFNAAGEKLGEGKYNTACFLFYVGKIRFRYYNATNPEYQASGDGALLGSLNYVFGEPVNMYLRCDVDNMIFILKMAATYCENNDYAFHPKSKGHDTYNDIIAKMRSQLIVDIEANKTKYAEEFAKSTNDFKNTLKEIEKNAQPEPKTKDDGKADKKKGNK